MGVVDRRPLIAVPKGRILEDIRPLFEEVGIQLPDTRKESRRMVFDDPGSDFRFFMLRGSDVPTYVEAGVADIGIAGLDVLEENKFSFYMPVDLKVGACTMCVIGNQPCPNSLKATHHPLQEPHPKPTTSNLTFCLKPQSRAGES